jgi:hypothetical protein
LLRTQGEDQLLVAATDLNVSVTSELKSQNTADGASRSAPGTSTSWITARVIEHSRMRRLGGTAL